MKKLTLLLLIITISMLSAACSSASKVEIDVDQCARWIADSGYMDDYDFVNDWAVTLDGSGTISMTIVVKDGTDPDRALQLADGLVRQVSAAACMQSDDLTGPTGDSYGTLYDSYPAMIGVSEASKTGDTKQWLILHSIANSSGPKVTLQ